MSKFLVELDDRDWDDICIIISSLTWGKSDSMNRWHALRERIEEKRLIKVEKPDPGE